MFLYPPSEMAVLTVAKKLSLSFPNNFSAAISDIDLYKVMHDLSAASNLCDEQHYERERQRAKQNREKEGICDPHASQSKEVLHCPMQ
jgi:hypothetical protein